MDSSSSPTSTGTAQELGGGVGNMPSRTKHAKTHFKTSTIVLGVGIFLGVVGASLLLGFGIGFVKPYMDVKHLRPGRCEVAFVNYMDKIVTCECGRDAGSCRSKYPCVRVLVNLTVPTSDLPNSIVSQLSPSHTYSKVDSDTSQPDGAHHNDDITDKDGDVINNADDIIMDYEDTLDNKMILSEDMKKTTIQNITLYDSFETFALQHQTLKVREALTGLPPPLPTCRAQIYWMSTIVQD